MDFPLCNDIWLALIHICFSHQICYWLHIHWIISLACIFERGITLVHPYAGFRQACHLPHCRFDDDISSTVQAPLAAEGWPSGKQRLANRSITLPLCPPWKTADSWILFNSAAMPLGEKAKAAWPLRAATLKQQAIIMRQSSERQASLKPALFQEYVLPKGLFTFSPCI